MFTLFFSKLICQKKDAILISINIAVVECKFILVYLDPSKGLGENRNI